jgi:hypothetical protein
MEVGREAVSESGTQRRGQGKGEWAVVRVRAAWAAREKEGSCVRAALVEDGGGGGGACG